MKDNLENHFLCFMFKNLKFSVFVFLVIFLVTPFFTASYVSAQIGQGISPEGAEDIAPGSIISRNPQTGIFYLSREESSSNVFGVIVENPIINIRPSEESDVSVLRTGEVNVNVVYTGEPIESGDYVTTFGYKGLGMLAGADHSYVIGTALSSFDEGDVDRTVEDEEGEELSVGSVLVDLQIGTREDEDGVSPVDEGKQGGSAASFGDHLEHYLAMVARYVMSALVAVGAIYFSYHFFKVNVSGGLSALGRNPMARQPIQKMMFFNMLLVVLVSVGGLLLSALILLIPVIINRLI